MNDKVTQWSALKEVMEDYQKEVMEDYQYQAQLEKKKI